MGGTNPRYTKVNLGELWMTMDDLGIVSRIVNVVVLVTPSWVRSGPGLIDGFGHLTGKTTEIPIRLTIEPFFLLQNQSKSSYAAFCSHFTWSKHASHSNSESPLPVRWWRNPATPSSRGRAQW